MADTIAGVRRAVRESETTAAPALRAPDPAPTRPRRRNRRLIATLRDGALALPALIVYIGLMIVPVGFAVYYSFTRYNGIPSQSPQWVGWDNYLRIFQDPANEMHSSVAVTAILAVIGSIAINLIALGLALLLHTRSAFNSIARAVMFYPYVLSSLIVGFLWRALLGPQGAANTVLEQMGLPRLPFLSDPAWAVGTLVAVIIWAHFGLQLVLYIAGLQAVPADLQEAARIDGASRWQVFRHVTWPALAPTVTITTITAVLALIKTYDAVLGLTNGGPGDATQTWAYEILGVSFANYKIGLACAQAVLLILVAAILSFSIMAFRRRAEEGAEAVG